MYRHGGARHKACKPHRPPRLFLPPPITTGRLFGPTVANGALRTWLDLQVAPPSRVGPTGDVQPRAWSLGPRYVTFTFQKIGASNLRTSRTFFRNAVG